MSPEWDFDQGFIRSLGCRAADPLQKLTYRHKAKLDDRSLVPHDD